MRGLIVVFELGLYRTQNGYLARITQRSHGCLLHGRVMEDTPQHKWVRGGTWRIYPWSVSQEYVGEEARFDRGEKKDPGLTLMERLPERAADSTVSGHS